MSKRAVLLLAIAGIVPYALGISVPDPAWARNAERSTAFADTLRWQVALSPAADLWFHGLAVIGGGQPGALPRYSARYLAAIRAEKERLGIYPTSLDERARDLADAISGDERLALLHFVPLYFHGVGPERLLPVLEAVARRVPTDRALTGRDVRFGAAILFGALELPSHRRTLRTLVDVLREEWEVFYRDHWNRYRRTEERRLVMAQQIWDTLATDLTEFLERNRLARGTLIPSPPLGGDGRLLAEDPADPVGTLIAVEFPLESDDIRVPLYGAVKELCGTFVGDVIAPIQDGRAEAAQERMRVAVRCGAMLLEFHAPALTAGYRRHYLRCLDLDVSSGTTANAFEQAFPLDSAALARLRERLRRR